MAIRSDDSKDEVPDIIVIKPVVAPDGAAGKESSLPSAPSGDEQQTESQKSSDGKTSFLPIDTSTDTFEEKKWSEEKDLKTQEIRSNQLGHILTFASLIVTVIAITINAYYNSNLEAQKSRTAADDAVRKAHYDAEVKKNETRLKLYDEIAEVTSRLRQSSVPVHGWGLGKQPSKADWEAFSQDKQKFDTIYFSKLKIFEYGASKEIVNPVKKSVEIFQKILNILEASDDTTINKDILSIEKILTKGESVDNETKVLWESINNKIKPNSGSNLKYPKFGWIIMNETTKYVSESISKAIEKQPDPANLLRKVD